MTRSLPTAQIQVSSGAVSPHGSGLPSFEAAVAAHVFEPELAVGGSAVRRVRFSARSRGLVYVIFHLWVGGALVLFWLANLDASGLVLGIHWGFYAHIWLSMGLYGVNAYLFMHHNQVRWLRDGVPVAAYVASLRVDNSGGVSRHVARVRYWRASDRLAEDDIEVSQAVYDHLIEGATLTLIQHPDQEETARPYYQFTTVEAI